MRMRTGWLGSAGPKRAMRKPPVEISSRLSRRHGAMPCRTSQTTPNGARSFSRRYAALSAWLSADGEGATGADMMEACNLWRKERGDKAAQVDLAPVLGAER